MDSLSFLVHGDNFNGLVSLRLRFFGKSFQPAHLSVAPAPRRFSQNGQQVVYWSVLEDIWDEGVRDYFRVARPVVSILALAPVDISRVAVGDHSKEEGKVQVRKEVGESTGHTPEKGHHHIARVMDLPGVGPPSIDEQFASTLGREVLGVLQSAPRELGERVSLDKGSSQLHSEAVPLALCGIPDVVDEEE